MIHSKIHLHWRAQPPCARFRTGVSLHSHTLHSREGLDFISQAARRAPLLASALRRGERDYLRIHAVPLDLSRGWWTPPLGPHDAWTLERSQIESLGMNALVSLTDHDDIEAPTSLQLLEQCRGVPISVEWTVPQGSTFLHLGVHNLPPFQAREFFTRMEQHRHFPDSGRLRQLLADLDSRPETLVVLNHPLWDETGIGAPAHEQVSHGFLDSYGCFIHALEINGLRPLGENRRVVALAKAMQKPLISGGDRHAVEPNAVLNLTNAAVFSEFAEEIRSGWSDVLVLPHYREPHALRIVHNLIDVLRTYERHAKGWRLWSDRAFYRCDDGAVRSLTELFGSRIPAPIAVFVSVLRLFSTPRIQKWLKGAWPSGGEVTL